MDSAEATLLECLASSSAAVDGVNSTVAKFLNSSTDHQATLKLLHRLTSTQPPLPHIQLLCELAAPKLYRIVNRCLSQATAETTEEVRLIVEDWTKSSTFEKRFLQNVKKLIDEKVRLQQHQKKVQRVASKSSAGSTAESSKQIRRYIEEERCKQKRRRLEYVLRPAGEDDNAEFEEVWERVVSMPLEKLHGHFFVDLGVGMQVVQETSATNVGDRTRHHVYVWDLDETLILFNSMLDPVRYQDRFKWDRNLALSYAERLEKVIFELLDSKLFFQELESVDASTTHIDALQQHDDLSILSSDNISPLMENPSPRHIAYRYRLIRSRFAQPLKELLSSDSISELDELMKSIDVLSSGWLLSARRALEASWASSAGTNVLVSSGQLTPTLAKLMLFGLSKFFDIDNIYSSNSSCKREVFERVMRKFSDQCEYHVIGDGAEEQQAAAALLTLRPDTHVKFHGVRSKQDLDHINAALCDGSFA